MPATERGHPRRINGVVNAQLVIPEVGVVTGGFRVQSGRIAEIWQGTERTDVPDDVIDAGGRYVLPGLIDPHVHLGLFPPLATRLQAESGFAASGGVTTLIHYFRRTEPYGATFPAYLEVARRHHVQDFAFHLTLFNREQVAEMETYVTDFGVTSFKLYMMLKGSLGRDIIMGQLTDDGSLMTADVDFDDGHLYDVFRNASDLPAKVRINVHAEDAEIVMRETERVRALGWEGLAAWHAARPGASEAIAIQKVAYLSRHFGVPIYFPHIGSREAVDALVDAKTKGTDYGAETGPQYLALTIEDPVGVLAKVTPPIRTSEDTAEVWQGLRTGLLHTVGSDHIAYSNEEKQAGSIWTTRPAFGGVGLILPILLTEGVHQGKLSIRRLAQVTSFESARLFGLYPRKGTLLPGADADFVIVDLDREWVVHASDLLSTSEFSVYEGKRMKGRCMLSAVRGAIVFDDGDVIGAPGFGRYYRRYPSLEQAEDSDE